MTYETERAIRDARDAIARYRRWIYDLHGFTVSEPQAVAGMLHIADMKCPNMYFKEPSTDDVVVVEEVSHETTD